MSIRIAAAADLAAIVEIHNQAIAVAATAHVEPLTVSERRQWLAQHGEGKRPILVAEEAGVVIGWASLSDYRPGRSATRGCAEVSYFVDERHRRQGIASALVQDVIHRCPALGIRVLLAILLANNVGSVQLLERFGFAEWGCLPGVVEVEAGLVDHLYYGLSLPRCPDVTTV